MSKNVSRLLSHDTLMLGLPFYQQEHFSVMLELDGWCQRQKATFQEFEKFSCVKQSKKIAKLLGKDGWLKHIASEGNAIPADARSSCLFRQTFAYYSDMLDFVYSIQSLSSSVIQNYGNQEQKQQFLPALSKGEKVGAFAVSELHAGSDIAAIKTTARTEGSSYVINGDKAWIGQGNIADYIIVIARTDEGPGALGMSAFIVDTSLSGIETETVGALAPRPWAHLKLRNVKAPQENLIGNPGQGFIIALDTLDRFRMTVAGTAIGFARRAYEIALLRSSERQIYKGRLLDLQLIKEKLVKMEIEIITSTLLMSKAAWSLDAGDSFAKDSAIAKYYSTEHSCKIIDDAVQILGATGIVENSPLERLYRQVRSLRIYEGASETLLMNIASAINVNHLEN